jgi:hypothetical protein
MVSPVSYHLLVLNPDTCFSLRMHCVTATKKRRLAERTHITMTRTAATGSAPNATFVAFSVAADTMAAAELVALEQRQPISTAHGPLYLVEPA